MKFNLGCGPDIREGYVNVDYRALHPNVIQADLSLFPWPWPKGCATEILMLDFLEHFPYRMTEVILDQCHSLLSPGGTLTIQVPDGDHIGRAFLQIPPYLCNDCSAGINDGDFRCPSCGKSLEAIGEAAMRRMFGGQDYQGNFHHTLFTRKSLITKVEHHGFKHLRTDEARHQYINWNTKETFLR